MNLCKENLLSTSMTSRNLRVWSTISFIALALLMPLCGCSRNNVRIHTIGDSTMADYEESTTQVRGWGEMFQQFVPQGAEVINHAIPGRSSKSFYDEGSWNNVKKQIRPGDFVFIQFAHNDEKANGEDDPQGRGTAPWSTYRHYLINYVAETRQLGAEPIFVQPIVRRYFSGNCITAKGRHNLSSDKVCDCSDTTLSYTAAMQSVANEFNVRVLDLTSKSCEIVEAYGPIESKKQIFVKADNTHTSAKGAAIFALATAEAFDTLNLWRGTIRRPTILTNPSQFDFGETFVNDTAWCSFDVIDLCDLSTVRPKYLLGSATIHAKVSPGFKIAHTFGAPLQDTLVIDNALSSNIICFFTPTSQGNIEGKIEFWSNDCGNKCRGSISLMGQGRDLKQKHDICLTMPTLRSPVSNDTLSVKLSTISGLKEEDGAFVPTEGFWPAEIDEVSNRYIQIRLTAGSKDIRINKISLKTSGSFCYRMACSLGNDFFQRATMGERHFCSHEAMTSDSYVMLRRIKAGKTLLIRIFPWSLGNCIYDTDDQTQPNSLLERFAVEDLVIEATAVE